MDTHFCLRQKKAVDRFLKSAVSHPHVKSLVCARNRKNGKEKEKRSRQAVILNGKENRKCISGSVLFLCQATQMVNSGLVAKYI